MSRATTRTRTSCRLRPDRYDVAVDDLETLAAAVIAAQRLLDDPPPPTPAQVYEAVAELGFYPSEADRLEWPLLRSWIVAGGL